MGHKNEKCEADQAHDDITLLGGYVLCVRCGSCYPGKEEERVPLKPIHKITLEVIFAQYPLLARKNRTAFFISELWRYIYEKKVVRITIMGETRGGKSEEAQTIAAKWYTDIWNALYDRGRFNTLDPEIKEKVVLERLTFTVENIHPNSPTYKYWLRDKSRTGKLRFGQISIIDEDKESEGGIGTFTEEMEEENLNNITAVFCQCEIWIKPKRFQILNTPYGLNCLIKHEPTRTNWSLIYKIEMESSLLREQNFIGWVCVPLHDDEQLRHEYKLKKNEWVELEFQGNINPRAVRRNEAINIMLQDDNFTLHTIGKDGNVKWHHGLEDMKFLVEEAIMEKRIDSFNESEIERIVHGARTRGEKRIKEGKHAGTNDEASRGVQRTSQGAQAQSRAQGALAGGEGQSTPELVRVRDEPTRGVHRDQEEEPPEVES